MKNKIDSSDISVVVQGQIVPKVTLLCLKNLRKYLSNAEIILSTWEYSDVSNLGGLYDVLVFNKAPKAVIFDDVKNKYNNINRILISSQSGLEHASRKYILRIRSDLILKNDNLLYLFDDLSKRNFKSSLFKEKIFAYEKFSIKYDEKNEIKQRMLFHISDWCYLGLKEDLVELFNIPLVKEPDFSRYFETHAKSVNDIHKTRLWKMSPEQYIISENAKKVFKNLNFENYLDITEENIQISEDFIINNFRIFSEKEWGFSSYKKEYKNIKMFLRAPYVYYSKFEQLKDYKKYCDKNANIKDENLFLYRIPYYEKLRKHFLQIFFCPFCKKFSEMVSIFYYLLKFTFTFFKGRVCKKK